MRDEYIDKLPLSNVEKREIEMLAAPTAAALMGMIKAAPEAFANFLGTERLHVVASALEALLGDRDREIIDSAAPVFNATGAIIGKSAPKLPPPPYDVDERDRLFHRLQQLRQQDDASPAVRQQIARLEKQLNALLETK